MGRITFSQPARTSTWGKPLLNENRWSATWLRSLLFKVFHANHRVFAFSYSPSVKSVIYFRHHGSQYTSAGQLYITCWLNQLHSARNYISHPYPHSHADIRGRWPCLCCHIFQGRCHNADGSSHVHSWYLHFSSTHY